MFLQRPDVKMGPKPGTGGPVHRFAPAKLVAALAACAITAGCGSGTAAFVPQRSSQAPDAAPAAGHIVVKPVASGYLRGDARGLQLWGRGAWEVDLSAGDAAVAAAASDGSQLSVTPERHTRGRFVLQARTVQDARSACPQCPIVRPGIVDLRVTVSAPGTAPQTYRIPVAIAHKIVAVSLNPLPNPSLGGSDAVLQYFDDNVTPSLIWDDFDLNNAHAFVNVGGLAFGADGSLYIANSGVPGTPGTVTKYAPGATQATPAKTFAAASLLSASAVALDKKGDVYVADNGYETVTRFATKGGVYTWHPGWEAGADVIGVAVDARRGLLDVAMSGVGDFKPHKPRVGRIAALPLDFTRTSTPSFTIDSTARDGVNEPYGLAIDGAGHTYALNDYVSIINGPPGKGPEYSTLTRYDGGIASAASRPSLTISSGLVWPLSVAVDATGNVYVANNTPPTPSNAPGTMWLFEYDGANLDKAPLKIDLSASMPKAYGPYYLNVQGIAVDPSPLR